MSLRLEHVIALGTGSAVLRASPTSETGIITAVGRALLVTDTTDPRRQAFYRGHDANVTALDVSFDGSLIATGQDASPFAPGHDAPVIVWKTPGMAQVFHLLGITRRVRALAFSPDGYLLAAAGGDNVIVIWDVRTSETVYLKRQGLAGTADDVPFITWGPVERPAGGSKPTYSLAFSLQDRVFVAVLTYDHSVLQYRVAINTAAFPSTGFSRLYACGAYAGGLLALGTTSGELAVFTAPPSGGPVFKAVVPAATGGVLALVAVAAPSGGGAVIYCGGGDGAVRALASGPGASSWQVRAGAWPGAAAMSPSSPPCRCPTPNP